MIESIGISFVSFDEAADTVDIYGYYNKDRGFSKHGKSKCVGIISTIHSYFRWVIDCSIFG